MLQYSPKIITDSLVMCLDPSQNKSYPTTDLPVKGGLLLWLDAADDSTFSYSSGSIVSQWRDKSGLNNHANQSVVGNQPSRSTFNNSRKSVNFVSSGVDYLLVSANSNLVLPGDASIFIVYKPATQTTAYAVLIDNYHGQGGAKGFVIQRVATNSQFYYGNGNGSGFVDTSASPWTYTDNVIQLLSLNKASSTGTPYISGTAQTSRTVHANTVQDTTGLAIGTWGLGGREYNGDMCEILIFNRSLSSTEMKQVHTYLGQKWGISNTDRSIVDLSGFNDNGLLGNGSTSNMPLFDYYNKGAFKFFASNKYIKLGNNTTINQFTGDFTVSLWAMAMAENSNYGNLIGDYYTFGVATTNEWQIMMNNSSAFLNVFRAGAGYIISNTSSGFSANTWINVVLTRVGSAITLYANNTVIGTATYSSVFGSATGSVNIGIDGNNVAEPFSGLISNVLIYQKGLSAAEVLQNYEAQKSKFATTIIQQGLVLNIDAANPYSYGGAGTTVYDTSNTALSWTSTNVTYNSDPIKYFSFNGSNSSLVSSTSTAYDSQTITMECWCYPSSLSQSGFLFEKGAVNTQYSMFFNGDGVFYFRTISISTQDLSFTSSSYLTANAWNHIVCTYGSGTKTVYINGAQGPQQTSLTGTLPTGQTNQYIGKYGALGDNFPFNGRIAESRVYNIALSAAQVLQNYNATRTKYGR
jgi:hypothetical protein